MLENIKDFLSKGQFLNSNYFLSNELFEVVLRNEIKNIKLLVIKT
jgi:hypothetical protein